MLKERQAEALAITQPVLKHIQYINMGSFFDFTFVAPVLYSISVYFIHCKLLIS